MTVGGGRRVVSGYSRLHSEDVSQTEGRTEPGMSTGKEAPDPGHRER